MRPLNGLQPEAAFTDRQYISSHRVTLPDRCLQVEIDQLKKMLKAGANWDVISQMMSYISDKAAQARSC